MTRWRMPGCLAANVDWNRSDAVSKAVSPAAGIGVTGAGRIAAGVFTSCYLAPRRIDMFLTNMTHNDRFFVMRARFAATRLRRLDDIKTLLKAHEHTTVGALAQELGVSVRTLCRDLDVLRDRGVPIESERGRGGGLRLNRSWSTGRLHLAPEEAIDLLLSMAIAEQIHSPMLLQRLDGVRRKISAAFSEGHRPRIRSLRQRILIGAPASAAVLASFAPSKRPGHAAIAEAFFHQRCIEIDYVDGNGAGTTRVVEPQYLYLSAPVWYLLCWDRLRSAIRCFRVDRVRASRLLDTSFRLGPVNTSEGHQRSMQS